MPLVPSRPHVVRPHHGRAAASAHAAPMTADARAVLYIADLEARISTLEARLARPRKVRDRLRQRLGRRVPHPRPPRATQHRDEDDERHYRERGFY
jgi:hypothetical protein